MKVKLDLFYWCRRTTQRKAEPTTRLELVTSSLPRTRSYHLSYVGITLERETGSNPRPTAWKAVTLPLSYSRLELLKCGGERRIRTSVARKERQIYSLLPLTTRPSLPTNSITGAGEGT